MNHLYNTKPHFQSIIDKQRIAHFRLYKDPTTRTLPERANYERTLAPVPLADIDVPKLPLVRLRQDDGRQFAVLGELAQLPGQILVVNIASNTIHLIQNSDLELLPPAVLD